MCRCQGPVLWLGPVVKEMHHAGGKRQDEPVGAEHHKMPCELLPDIVYLLVTGLLVSLYSHFNIGIENTIIHTQPLSSPLLLNLIYSSALLSSESYNLLHTLPVHSQLASSSP